MAFGQKSLKRWQDSPAKCRTPTAKLSVLFNSQSLAETFFRHPGKVLSREQLLDQVWGCDYESASNIVDVYVGYLRRKLGSHLIETVRGMGYRLKV